MKAVWLGWKSEKKIIWRQNRPDSPNTKLHIHFSSKNIYKINHKKAGFPQVYTPKEKSKTLFDSGITVLYSILLLWSALARIFKVKIFVLLTQYQCELCLYKVIKIQILQWICVMLQTSPCWRLPKWPVKLKMWNSGASEIIGSDQISSQI